MRRPTLFVSFALVGLTFSARGGSAEAASPILDESCSWRRYYRFATDHVSPEALKRDGVKALGQAAFDRLKKETEKGLNRSAPDSFAVLRPAAAVLSEARKVGTGAALGAKADPAAADWRDYVFQRMFFDPYTAPPPPEEWAAADFDDAAWVLARGTFQADLPNDLPPEKTEGNMAKIHVGALQFIGTGMLAAYYRTRFVVTDPAAADLSLRVVYRGGVRVFLNGKEIARGHLPRGKLAPDTPGEDYPLDAYQQEKLRDRALGSVAVPQALLRKGANVLAVEVRASDLHPILLAKPQSRSWNALHDRERIWRHGHFSKIELRGSGGVESAAKRPAGVQVWAEDIHRRVESTDFRPPGEGAGVARVVGAKNGAYSAQIVLGTDKDLGGLEVTPSALKLAGGAGEISPDAIRVSFAVPIPAAELSDKLGDERGLGGAFPSANELADLAAMGKPGPHVFDQLASAAPRRIPAGTARPVWLSVKIPADAKAGVYKGSVTVAAQGLEAVRVPVEAEVIDWRLPDPKDFRTFVACEENPYAVAKQYGVPLWSKEHWRLLEASFRELGRVGADEWAAAHYQGMQVPVWIVGMPVLFTLWPGRDGAESSARHEALLEGIQEGEARIAIEQALDRGRLSADVARRGRAALDEHFRQTSFFQNKLCIFELERYHHGWQARSRRPLRGRRRGHTQQVTAFHSPPGYSSRRRTPAALRDHPGPLIPL